MAQRKKLLASAASHDGPDALLLHQTADALLDHVRVGGREVIEGAVREDSLIGGEDAVAFVSRYRTLLEHAALDSLDSRPTIAEAMLLVARPSSHD